MEVNSLTSAKNGAITRKIIPGVLLKANPCRTCRHGLPNICFIGNNELFGSLCVKYEYRDGFPKYEQS